MSESPRRSSPLWGAVPLFVIGLAGCDMMPPRVWVESERIIQLSDTDVDQLALYTKNGQVTVRPNESGDEAIVVVARIKAGGRDDADAQAALDAIELSTPRAGDHGEVQEVRSLWAGNPASNWQAKVSFDVTMPRTMDLLVGTSNGDIDVEGLESKCELGSHNGSVEVRDAGTELEASTHNGAITVRTPAKEIELETHNGAVRAVLLSAEPTGRATSHNGRVQIRVQPEAAFAFNCQVHNGGIDVGELPTTHIEKTRRSVAGQVGADAGDRHLSLETHNGQVSLGLISAKDLSSARAEEKPRSVVRRKLDADEQAIRERAQQLEQELDAEPAASAGER